MSGGGGSTVASVQQQGVVPQPDMPDPNRIQIGNDYYTKEKIIKKFYFPKALNFKRHLGTEAGV